jgi:hypothetical protein
LAGSGAEAVGRIAVFVAGRSQERAMTTTPTLWKSQTQVNSTDGGLQDEAQIAALPDGGYVIVWKDDSHVYNPSGFAVVGQRYDSAGSKVGGEVNISEFYLGDQNAPAITVLPNGNIAVAFMDFFPGGLLSDTDIYVRVYDSAFNPDPIRTDVIRYILDGSDVCTVPDRLRRRQLPGLLYGRCRGRAASDQ